MYTYNIHVDISCWHRKAHQFSTIDNFNRIMRGRCVDDAKIKFQSLSDIM